jgi:hypothetical protein
MRKALSLAAIVIVLAIAFIGYRHISAVHADPEPFNGHKWRERSDQTLQNDPGCVRGGMALTLTQSGGLLNLTKEKVLEQLGQAEAVQTSQLRYSLGQCHWDWRHSSLVVTFNPSGSVASASIEAE